MGLLTSLDCGLVGRKLYEMYCLTCLVTFEQPWRFPVLFYKLLDVTKCRCFQHVLFDLYCDMYLLLNTIQVTIFSLLWRIQNLIINPLRYY